MPARTTASGSVATPSFPGTRASGRDSTGRTGVPRIWWIVLALSLAISAYAFLYVLRGEDMFFGEVGAGFRLRPWAIFAHAASAMFALAVGPFQFRKTLRTRRLALHRALGKIYVIAALLTGLTGLYMAIYSFGGLITHLGFGFLAAGVLITTSVAWRRIRARDIEAHREWMIRSFALIFGAVTLRILLPVLIIVHQGAFEPAYLWVSWLSWIPNVAWAEWYVRHARSRRPTAVPAVAPV
jgi:uncharacterized membrane protein